VIVIDAQSFYKHVEYRLVVFVPELDVKTLFLLEDEHISDLLKRIDKLIG
jgi:hypothetical protein